MPSKQILIRPIFGVHFSVVLFYQLFGSLGEWAWTGSAAAALQDIRIGLPGMLAQVFAGYAVLRYLLRN